MTLDRTPRIAVVGTGYWGKNLVRNFHALGALAALCDTDQAATAALGKQFPHARIEPDYLKLLDDPDIDAVALATPAATHDAMAETALRRGKDVFVEKPLALRAERGRELVALAAQQGRVLMVGHLLRYHPAVRVLGGMVQRGELGQLRYIYSNRLNFGKIRDEENILWSFAPHDISLILHLVRDVPTRVQATGGAYLNAHVADVTVTHLTFRNGVRAHIHVSWLHPDKDQRLVVIGDKGMAVFNDQEPWPRKLVLYKHAVEWIDSHPIAHKADAVEVEIPEEEPLRNECRHFLECIATRGRPLTDGEEGLRVLQVLQAAQQSLDEDRAVDPAVGMAPPAPVRAPEAPRFKNVTIHPTAQVDGPVTIGEGTKVWHFSKLLGPLDIGRDCILGQNVVVERNVTIGDNVKIQNNVSVYSGVILEDDVFCGPSMVFTNVSTPRSHFPRRGQYAVTRVKKGASIGANATVVCGHTLGRYCFVGAGAVVTRDVPDYALVYGNPAKIHGFACYCGARLPLDTSEGSEEGTCPDCARRYTRQGLEVKELTTA